MLIGRGFFMNEAPISREDLKSLSKDDLLALIRKKREERSAETRVPYINNMTASEVKRLIDMLPTPKAVFDFLEKFANKIGAGSSRAVFNIGPETVLKVATNQAGVLQNKSEISTWEELQPFVPKIYDYHPQGYWIEMESVLSSDSYVQAGFEEHIDLLSTLIDSCGDLQKSNSNKSVEDILKDSFEFYESNGPRIEELNLKLASLAEEYSNTRSDIRDYILLKKVGVEEKDGVITDDKIEELKSTANRLESEINSVRLELYDMLEFMDSYSRYIYKLIKKTGVTLDLALQMLEFAKKIHKLGISDFDYHNFGYSEKRGIPVLLDFGYDKNNKDMMRIYDTGAGSPGLNSKEYFEKTSDPNPRIAMESFFIE